MRKPKFETDSKEEDAETAEAETAPSTGMELTQALNNLNNVARAIQGTAQTHELLAESMRVVKKACGVL